MLFAHAGHTHPEQASAAISSDTMAIVGVTLGVLILVVALVVFDRVRKRS